MISIEKFKREISATAAFAALLIAVAVISPSFFNAGNLSDLILNNAPTLIVVVGMTDSE